MERYKALDGLRGYAAIAVLIYHSILGFNLSLIDNLLYKKITDLSGWRNIVTKLFLQVFNGETAVLIFFVLSGFVLFHSLISQIKKEHSFIASSFIIKRIARIYIPLIPCIVVFFILLKVMHVLEPTSYPELHFIALIENITLYKITIHGPSWTLQTEIIAIPFILIGFFGYKRWGTKAVIFLVGIALLNLYNTFYHLDIGTTRSWMLDFSIGFLCAACNIKRLKPFINKVNWIIPLFILLFLRCLIANDSLNGIVIQAFCIGLFVLNLRICESPVRQFFENRISQYLGKISFSFYLWNVLLINLVAPLKYISLVHNHALEFGLLSATIIFFITLPVAHFSAKYIENWSIIVGKKLSSVFIGRVSKFALLNYRK